MKQSKAQKVLESYSKLQKRTIKEDLNNLVVDGRSYDLTKNVTLKGTKITSLPKSLKVGGKIYKDF
jgi:hypothetical protein